MKGHQYYDGRWWDTEDILLALRTYYDLANVYHRERWLISVFKVSYWCYHQKIELRSAWPFIKSEIRHYEKSGELPFRMFSMICPHIRAAEQIASHLSRPAVDKPAVFKPHIAHG
ncbi:MAG: hypothetical protein WDZ68_00120 [Candidatus Paceibacterota bacterium]